MKKTKISVLMSVYNEIQSQIEQSIQSILAQSYSDFELIIINDNPKNEELSKWLCEMSIQDPRIRLYQNEINMGLALSMNRAAQVSTGEYFARMDADDISEPSRFEKQVRLLDQGEYDLICTGYTYIDDEGQPINQHFTIPTYSDYELNKKIYMENCIHHPTVMMKREMFECVGGYRDFPCAQDYDLWLRMAHVGCRFHMIGEPLLRYRVREGSITSQKRIQQKITLEYTRRLYIQRLMTGKDEFSRSQYEQYVSSRIRNGSLQKQDLEKNRAKLQKAYWYKGKGNLVMYFVLRFLVLVGSNEFRRGYIEKIKYQCVRAICSRKKGDSK